MKNIFLNIGSAKEEEDVSIDIGTTDIKKLIIYNSQHFWNDVIHQLQKATGYDLIHCEQIAVIAHTKGKAVVKSGELDELSKINAVLLEINLITEIE